MDSSNIDVSSDSDSSEHEDRLKQLQQQVELSAPQLREITQTQEFIERVIELNNNSKESIEVNRPLEGLVYLAEAERILQHAANSGNRIDKTLVIHILHNEACCHQMTWELQKCSGYLQALIYNYNSYLKNCDGEQAQPSEEKSDSVSSSYSSRAKQFRKSKEFITIQNIEKKNELAKYYLQFDVVNSQSENHSGALVAGRKAVDIIKNNFRDIYGVCRRLKKSPYEKKFDSDLRTKIVDTIVRLNDNLCFPDFQILLSTTLFYLRQWNACQTVKDRQRNHVLEEQFKHYSIGKPINLTPMQYCEQKQLQHQYGGGERVFSAKNILEKLLLLSICYFTIGTELRCISEENRKKKSLSSSQESRISTELKESQLYHLLSISLVCAFVPFDILLVRHLVDSYQNHYGRNLFEEIQKPDETANRHKNSAFFEAFLFPESNRINEPPSSIIETDRTMADEEEKNIIPTVHQSLAFTPKAPKKTNTKLLNSQKIGLGMEMSSQQRSKNPSMKCLQTEQFVKGRKSNPKSPEMYKNLKTDHSSNRKIPTTKISSSKKKPKSKSKNPFIMGTSQNNYQKRHTGDPSNSNHSFDKSAIPKSPKAHQTSSRDSKGIVKIKTTHRLKISTEKIEYHNEKEQKKNSPPPNQDYFMTTRKGKSKSKKNELNSMRSSKSKIMMSPKTPRNTSKSSNKSKQSPILNYLNSVHPKAERKTIKSPKMYQGFESSQGNIHKAKQQKKNTKKTFQEYYL